MSSQRSLLATIEDALKAKPPCVIGNGSLRVHTLFSIPRQVKTLYPLAHIHPTDVEKSRQQTPISAHLEQIFVTASWTPTDGATILIAALELYLYTLPAYGSAVLYISKLDSSGYGPWSVPSSLRSGAEITLTAALTSAATGHFTTFRHWEGSGNTVDHVAVHILARSQRAYLFPSSPDNKDKQVLSDGGLIKWWRDVMSHVICGENRSQDVDTRAFYLIPGYNKLESHPLVPLVQQQTSATGRQALLQSANWVYGHPYSPAGAQCSTDDLPPLPLHWRRSSFITRKPRNPAEQDPSSIGFEPTTVLTVPTLMPHFSDDPKTRFLDEMARDAHEHAGWKRKSTNNVAVSSTTEMDNQPEPKRAKVENETPEDTAANKITATTNGPPLVAIRASMRERAMLDDLPVDEFWERMGFRQECCSGNAVGVIVCLFTRRTPIPSDASAAVPTTVERQPLSLPHKVMSDMIFHRLMRDVCEWNKRDNAIELTRGWFAGVDREVRRKGGITSSDFASDAEFVGKGQLWTDIQLAGPSHTEVDKLREEQKSKAAEAGQGAVNTPANGANVLNVKRKKRPL